MQSLQLAEAFKNGHAQCLKIIFERCCNWLRFGCMPLLVLDGISPQAKAETRALRALRRGAEEACSSSSHTRIPANTYQSINKLVVQLLNAMGLPHVQAVGEAEATCAALNKLGFVDGCHSTDVDSLLFGATAVYKKLKLRVDGSAAKDNEVEVIHMSGVRRQFGLQGGGQLALMAMAQLIGGDYNTGGAKGVGKCLAFDGIRALLAGSKDDSNILQVLAAALERGPDPRLMAMTACTGCKNCGHESAGRGKCKQHSRAGCGGCGTLASKGGPGGCVYRVFSLCECEFHRMEGQRLLTRMIDRATQTPGFLQKCEVAQQTYLDQAATATESISHLRRDVFRSWSHRPNVSALCDILGKHLGWGPSLVCSKTMPLLLEWDLRQGPNPNPSLGVQFKPVSIQKMAGSCSGKDTSDAAGVGDNSMKLPSTTTACSSWRYLLKLETYKGGASSLSTQPQTQISTSDAETEEVEAVLSTQLEPTRADANVILSVEDLDLDTEALTFATSARASLRSVRMALIDNLWPEIQHQVKTQVAKKAAGLKKAGGPSISKAKPTGMEGHEGALLKFFQPKKAVTRQAPAAAAAAAVHSKEETLVPMTAVMMRSKEVVPLYCPSSPTPQVVHPAGLNQSSLFCEVMVSSGPQCSPPADSACSLVTDSSSRCSHQHPIAAGSTHDPSRLSLHSSDQLNNPIEWVPTDASPDRGDRQTTSTSLTPHNSVIKVDRCKPKPLTSSLPLIPTSNLDCSLPSDSPQAQCWVQQKFRIQDSPSLLPLDTTCGANTSLLATCTASTSLLATPSKTTHSRDLCSPSTATPSSPRGRNHQHDTTNILEHDTTTYSHSIDLTSPYESPAKRRQAGVPPSSVLEDACIKATQQIFAAEEWSTPSSHSLVKDSMKATNLTACCEVVKISETSTRAQTLAPSAALENILLADDNLTPCGYKAAGSSSTGTGMGCAACGSTGNMTSTALSPQHNDHCSRADQRNICELDHENYEPEIVYEQEGLPLHNSKQQYIQVDLSSPM
ncbi:hypothetical protein CEUSTIGMA_g10404.t1 [Chlamydomonas eustigma]|uniref:XPG-I domain-containing protein n=1 Tax=Chlamydomonas eustigma TaxID=1157962 RepID=A0A250XIS1_9CHLO|nr:hypothetical protein CEUSTIGMA_g10404.t1 [Chlamydomonas eustigma]|eukprot:GAX82977.1 hypothetical protein CEUSTIGMA_g10404.t1 [Chlamydomonas eustigma]